MNFSEAISIVASTLEKIGSSINKAVYDGIIVKELKASNTLDTDRGATNQTHIAITGSQMDLFPYVRATGYFDVDYKDEDDALKKYMVAQIPVTLHQENINYLDSNAEIIDGDMQTVYCSVVRSRRDGAADQVQLSMTNMDSPEFVAFRKIVHTGSYIIFLKKAGAISYDLFAVLSKDANELTPLNNSMYKDNGNTLVRIDEVFSNREKFKSWLSSQKDEDDEDLYKPSYVSNLTSALSQIHNNYGMPNVYIINNALEYFKVKEQIEAEENFQAMNIACGNRALQPALNLYGQFLSKEKLQSITNRAKGGYNKIYYGAPGCGKSRFVSDMLNKASVLNENKIRVTFHPEYANCDFIGQILPTISMNDEGEEVVKYIFNPGPFTLALKTAYNTSDMVYLVIEEINRGNAAAIFGDMFQLLDRVKDENSADFTDSEYPVCNPNMQEYLSKNVQDSDVIDKLKGGVFIPSNLTILATMNSSDQNVFTLDTAFKRRWSFEQISNDINNDHNHSYKDFYIPGTNVTWAVFLSKINETILDYKIQNQTNEDKRLGKYFVTKDCLTEKVEAISDVDAVARDFAYKVLEYIWNDVCKIGREDWFNTEKYKTLEDLVEAFTNPKDDESPLSVFQNISFI